MLDLLSQPYTDHRVDDISRRLQAYYKARGYYAVKVEAAGEPERAARRPCAGDCHAFTGASLQI